VPRCLMFTDVRTPQCHYINANKTVSPLCNGHVRTYVRPSVCVASKTALMFETLVATLFTVLNINKRCSGVNVLLCRGVRTMQTLARPRV
jgi:hypothetical protein